jgi:hypothetical protein
VANSENSDAKGKRQHPKTEPALEKIIKAMGFGAQFALPGVLCGPVFRSSERDGMAMRVLLSLFWVSTDALKNGTDVLMQAALSDLRHASGFTKYNGNGPVREAIEALKGEVCVFSEGDEIPVFAEFDIVQFKDLQIAQWRFNPDFAALFYNPPRFAVLDIREICSLTKGIDVFLYRQAMLVKKMRRPEFRLPSDELHRICEISMETPFKRVVERIKRSLTRVIKVSDMTVDMDTIQERGSRSLAGMSFHVSAKTQEDAAA